MYFKISLTITNEDFFKNLHMKIWYQKYVDKRMLALGIY